MPDITLHINGDKHTSAETNLAKVLDTYRNNAGEAAHAGANQSFAVARNGEFVPKSQYAATELNDGDTLDIVTPVGGG